jgi:RNA-directed DNA polymerase
MSGKQQNIQYSLALEPKDRGETSVIGYPRAEPLAAKPALESPAVTEQLMEEVCEGENLQSAWKRVQRNQGSPGVDGMTIDDAKGYLREHWPSIRSQLLEGTYQPLPVKRVEIPKPDGGVRKLGVPCVVDRLIQQALLQVLQERWDPTFSKHSYGFRPGRTAHQAVAQAQRYVAEGYNVVVDLDLEKFFDRVNHDCLMARVAARISDKRLLKLIRAFLNAGVMEDGLVVPVDEGTPQGGPLSPLLSNIMLDDLDKELTRRGLRFCRYADDCNIYVRSQRAGERVMASVSRFLTTKLRLKVSEAKSAVARPEERKFLGFSISNDGSERRIAPKALDKFKERIREMTSRTRGLGLLPRDNQGEARTPCGHDNDTSHTDTGGTTGGLSQGQAHCGRERRTADQHVGEHRRGSRLGSAGAASRRDAARDAGTLARRRRRHNHRQARPEVARMGRLFQVTQ